MAIYPTSAGSDSTLYVSVNNKITSLSSAINAAVTTIPVASTTGFPAVGFISVDSEIIAYTSVDATNFLGATRASDGSSAASHSINSLVSHNIIAVHHNVLKDEVIAVETDLVAVKASITPVAAANTATSVLNRIAMIAQRFKDLTGLANWYDAFVSFPINKGGTNSVATLNNNRVMQSSGGAIVEAAAITASRALASDTNGIPVAVATTAAELAFVNGVTSALQTQLNAKAPTASPTFTGTVTTPSVTFNSTSGIIGTTTNNNAAAGSVGEYIESTVTSQAAPTSGVVSDVTSINLTAGDWDVSVICNFNAGTSITVLVIGIGTASGTGTTGLIAGVNQAIITSSAVSQLTGVVPPYRVSISGSSTYYLKGNFGYTGGGSLVNARISARRVR